MRTSIPRPARTVLSGLALAATALALIATPPTETFFTVTGSDDPREFTLEAPMDLQVLGYRLTADTEQMIHSSASVAVGGVELSPDAAAALEDFAWEPSSGEFAVQTPGPIRLSRHCPGVDCEVVVGLGRSGPAGLDVPLRASSTVFVELELEAETDEPSVRIEPLPTWRRSVSLSGRTEIAVRDVQSVAQPVYLTASTAEPFRLHLGLIVRRRWEPETPETLLPLMHVGWSPRDGEPLLADPMWAGSRDLLKQAPFEPVGRCGEGGCERFPMELWFDPVTAPDGTLAVDWELRAYAFGLGEEPADLRLALE